MGQHHSCHQSCACNEIPEAASGVERDNKRARAMGAEAMKSRWPLVRLIVLNLFVATCIVFAWRRSLHKRDECVWGCANTAVVVTSSAGRISARIVRGEVLPQARLQWSSHDRQMHKPPYFG